MSDEYNRRLDAMNDKVDAAILASGEKTKEEFVDRLKNGVANLVVYSAYPVIDDLPIDNLDDIAVEGTFVVIGTYDEFWDSRTGFIGNSMNSHNKIKGGNAYKSDPITNPTWLQLSVLANESIIITNDLHHVFLEGVRERRGTLELLFGS